jgi:hypothetical protein
VSSPSQRYVVRLEEISTAAVGGQLRTMASVMGQKGTLVNPFAVYQAGFLDTAFRKRYPNYVWVSDETLQFPSDVGSFPRLSSSVEVRNDTTTTLPAIMIEAWDLVLLFNMSAGSQRTVHVGTPADMRPCVQATTIPQDRALSIRGEQCFEKGTKRYHVIVGDRKIQISE